MGAAPDAARLCTAGGNFVLPSLGVRPRTGAPSASVVEQVPNVRREQAQPAAVAFAPAAIPVCESDGRRERACPSVVSPAVLRRRESGKSVTNETNYRTGGLRDH